MNLIYNNIHSISDLCRKYNIISLYVFGSILTSRFNDSSDIDFLVNFNKTKIPLHEYANNFFSFMYEMEELLGRKIDLVCDDAVSNPYFREELDDTKQLIYG